MTSPALLANLQVFFIGYYTNPLLCYFIFFQSGHDVSPAINYRKANKGIQGT